MIIIAVAFMSSGLVIDDIIMNLFSDITKQTTDSVKKDLFSKIQDYNICTKDLCKIILGKQ